jgi:hypothetical protein
VGAPGRATQAQTQAAGAGGSHTATTTPVAPGAGTVLPNGVVPITHLGNSALTRSPGAAPTGRVGDYRFIWPDPPATTTAPAAAAFEDPLVLVTDEDESLPLTAEQKAVVDKDFVAALERMDRLVAALRSDRPSPAVVRLLDWYFAGHDPQTLAKVRLGATRLRTALADVQAAGHIRYTPKTARPPRNLIEQLTGAIKAADARATRVTDPQGREQVYAHPVRLSPYYFVENDADRRNTLVHEASHLTGTDDVAYFNEQAFLTLDTAGALNNAESFAMAADAMAAADVVEIPARGLISGEATAGAVFGPHGDGWHLRLGESLEWRHPAMRLVNPTLGFSIDIIGVEDATRPPGYHDPPAMALELRVGVLIGDSRRPGGTPSLKLEGAPALVLGGDTMTPGLVAGVSAGYRWTVVDVHMDAEHLVNPGGAANGVTTLSGGVTFRFVNF